MSKDLDRRKFLKTSVATSAAAALGLSLEEKVLLANEDKSQKVPESGSKDKGLPTGKIGNIKISRLICGGNLVAGYAHSRNLIYVSSLLLNYFTDEKILETFQLAEQNGINTVVLNNMNRDFKAIRILNKYWKQEGGMIQWLAQVNPSLEDIKTNIKLAIDNGAVGAFIQCGLADSWVARGKSDAIAKAIDFMKQNGLIAGCGGHSLDVPIALETAQIEVDFYFKTLNSTDYYCHRPDATIDFMKEVEKPWIGYKVLGAGAVHPNEGFKYALENGTDFICVGMFDFQIQEDVEVARKLILDLEKTGRTRLWRG